MRSHRKLAREKYYAWRKDYRLKLAERTRLLGRINYWRREQARLAQEELEFSSYKPYNDNLEHSFSTFGLSEQLNTPTAL